MLAFRASFMVTVAALLASQTGAAAAESEGKSKVSVGASSKGAPADTPSKPFKSPLKPVLGIGPALFTEDTDLIEERRADGDRDGPAERDSRISDGILALQAWYLTPWLLERLRVGPGLAWYNEYTLAPEDEDNNNDENYHAGQAFQLFGQAEYVLIDIAGKLDILLGLRAGGIVLVPGRDLQDRLDELEGQGFDVWQSPRLGAMISPHAGVLWPLNDRLSVRADLGVQFSKVWLYSAEAEAGDSLIELNSHLLTTRTQLLLGLEFSL